MLSTIEHKVVVFGGAVVLGFGRQLAGHAQVNSQPTIPAKTKKHLFSMGLNRGQGLSGQGLD
jgi:hypothetical protein